MLATGKLINDGRDKGCSQEWVASYSNLADRRVGEKRALICMPRSAGKRSGDLGSGDEPALESPTALMGALGPRCVFAGGHLLGR
jgi:hypothetical protein